MNRRSILATTGAMVGTLTAGCTGPTSMDTPAEYTFGVYNYSSDTHSFHVRIENSSTGVIHRETVELEGGTANEENAFTEDPVRIFVEIDSSGEHNLPWPASSTAEGEISTNAEIRFDQSNQREVLVFG